MSERKDLTGQRFGRLVVQEMIWGNRDARGKSITWCTCLCDCGKICIKRAGNLQQSGELASCGCATGMTRRKDLTGQRFGHLVVQEMLFDHNARGESACKCLCDCGQTVIKNTYKLKSRQSEYVSCGCMKKRYEPMSYHQEKIGVRYGRLTILKLIGGRNTKAVCQCDCGNITTPYLSNVLSGTTRSCGCYRKDKTKEALARDYTGEVSSLGVKILEYDSQNHKGKRLWKCECPLCQKNFLAIPTLVLRNEITSCGCKIKSIGEKYIQKQLEEGGYVFQPQFRISECRDKYPLPFDFAVFNSANKLIALIEYDGKQHQQPIKFFGGDAALVSLNKHDDIKTEYCKTHHIPLLRLTYKDSFENIKTQIQQVLEQTSIL